MGIRGIRQVTRIRGIDARTRVARIEPLPRTIAPPVLTAKEKLALRGITSTDIEAPIFLWLEGRGYQAGIDFSFQSSLFGGRQELGGNVADFIIYRGQPIPLIIRAMGEYWHEDPEQQAKDDRAKSDLERYGYVVVDIWGTDIKESLNYAMEMALRGLEVR